MLIANSHDALREISARNGNTVALRAPNLSDTTFAELQVRVDLARSKFAGLGIRRGDRVGVISDSRDLMAAAHLSVISIGTSAPLPPDIGSAELEHAVEVMRLDYLIVESSLTNLLSYAKYLPARVIEIERRSNSVGDFAIEGASSHATVEPTGPLPSDVAVLLRTSGTTDRPKIVPRTHAWQLRILEQHDASKRLGPGDRVLNLLPLHHTEGLNFQFLRPLLSGATVVLDKFNPDRVIRLLHEYEITKFTMVPSMHLRVVEWWDSQAAQRVDLSLRYVESSSAKLLPQLRARIEEIYAVPVVEDYGATEAGALAYMSLDQSDLPVGSVGKPAHTGVVIMDEDGHPVPPDLVGEVCVKGPDVIDGFENNPDANALQFQNGWYRTGDQGYVNADGFLFITGRTVESIGRGGEQIAPLEVDEVLNRHPEVADAAAFGVEDDNLGMEVWAAVVPAISGDLDSTGVRAFASRSLPFSKVPKRIVQVDAIPLNGVGKIDRSHLSRHYGLK